MKRIIALLIMIVTTLTLVACKSDSDELQIFLYQEQVVYDSEMAIFKKANEMFDIKLEGFLQRFDSNYRTRFTTGGYRSNLVIYDQDTVEEYGFNGTYIDLKPYIDEHAPNIKAHFEENPTHEAWATAADGKIYGVPFYTDGKTAKGYFVRKDWVDKLRAANKINDIPEDLNTLTVEQFEELLIAFKDNKSLLTNATNIRPFFDQDEEFWVSELASLWDATGEFYVDDNNQVQFGPLQDEFRVAIQNIARWMDLGLIDPAILDGSAGDDRQTYFARNEGGATRGWIGTTYSFNDDVYADVMVDGFEVVAIAPPESANGNRVEPTIRKEIGKVAAIYQGTSEENRIKLIKWIDYFFSAEGIEELNFGIEGESFTKSDGKYTYTDKIINDNATALANLYKFGAQLQSPGVQRFEYEEAWLSEEAAAAMALYEDNNYLDLNYTKLIYPNIKLSSDEYKAVNAARTQIKYELDQQIYTWIITGTAKNGVSDSDWATFKALMVQSGSQTIIDTYQAHINK